MRKTHVLVVDDDHDTCDAVADLLGCEGFDVHCATSGRQALDELRRHGKPCIMICDVLLPDMLGGAIVDTCRNDPELCTTTIVMMTGTPDAAPDGVLVLRKPFGLDAFVALVEQHCGEGAGDRSGASAHA